MGRGKVNAKFLPFFQTIHINGVIMEGVAGPQNPLRSEAGQRAY